MAPIFTNELHVLHRTDSELFYRLIYNKKFTITYSLLIMVLWLWLENTGYPNIIAIMVNLSDPLVNSLANEAITCLNFLEWETPIIPIGGGLPLTRTLVKREISLTFFTEQRFTKIAGIKSILNSICSRIFNDIILHVLLGSNNNNTNMASTPSGNSGPLVVPGFPHPLFGDFSVTQEIEALDLYDMRIWTNGRPSDQVTKEDKIMFLTFSRGFHVSEEEARQVFTSKYGDCGAELIMGNVDENNQPMFAAMVVNEVAAVDRILNGNRIAEFKVNGKDIWARKYEYRDM